MKVVLMNAFHFLRVRHPNQRKITVHVQETHFLMSFGSKAAKGFGDFDHERGGTQSIPWVPGIDLLYLLFGSGAAIRRSCGGYLALLN